MSALNIRIPAGHAAHWKLTERGKIEVELMRFLTVGGAKARQCSSFDHINRKAAA